MPEAVLDKKEKIFIFTKYLLHIYIYIYIINNKFALSKSIYSTVKNSRNLNKVRKISTEKKKFLKNFFFVSRLKLNFLFFSSTFI